MKLEVITIEVTRTYTIPLNMENKEIEEKVKGIPSLEIPEGMVKMAERTRARVDGRTSIDQVLTVEQMVRGMDTQLKLDIERYPDLAMMWDLLSALED